MLRLHQDPKDGKCTMFMCYGAIARLCQSNHSLIPLFLGIRKFWNSFYANDEMQPGLQDILFALEHFHVSTRSKIVVALCKPIWRLMFECSDITKFVEQYILVPMCSALTFEARILVGRHIAIQFQSSFELEMKNARLFARQEQRPDCVIVNCVCNKQQNMSDHACDKECKLIDTLLADMFEETQEQQPLKRARQ